MKLFDWVNKDDLNDLIEKNLVSARLHPKYPLIILNYTPAAQSEKDWSETLCKCRGLVYEAGTQEVVAIPFSKFWNFNDPSRPETLPENLPPGQPRIFQKVDGSLGVGFFYRGEFIVATRGSFESDQAKWATRWASERLDFTQVTTLEKKRTYLFEIVMPQDKKVVYYGWSGLVLLGMNSTDFPGDYPPNYLLVRWLKDAKVCLGVPYEDLEKLREKDIPNEEGYVAVWYNGLSTKRVKIKFDTYKKLHRLFFQTTTDVIWELLKNQGDVNSYTKDIEDQGLRNWVYSEAIKMCIYKGSLDKETRVEYHKISQFLLCHFEATIDPKMRRKAFAMEATKCKHPNLLFLLYDSKNEEYQNQLWKIVRPQNSFYRRDEE